MNSRIYFLILFLISLNQLKAQDSITYILDLSKIQQHELGVLVEFTAVPMGPFTVSMPMSSPGRYAAHNFAKNVYAVNAYDSKGSDLDVTRIDVNDWIISGHDGAVNFTYTLFADQADGTFSKVDNRKLHLNMPATFVYGQGLDDRPIVVELPTDRKADWDVATQLPRVGPRRFAAPNYYYFYDSPLFFGNMRFRRWTISNGDRRDTIEMAFMTPDQDILLDSFADWTKKIVAEQIEIFGELPAFDYNRYTFLCAYNPYVNGDGMEHRNSTICSAPMPLKGSSKVLISTIAHEFFHAWNVERLRPSSLEPFDFSRPNISGELWFGEGFTSYYESLTQVRAGIINQEEYLDRSSSWLNYFLFHPGRQFGNPIQMSNFAPFADANASYEDNFNNVFINYYVYGYVLALGLDLELRVKFDLDLDSYMRLLWHQFGKSEIPYNITDLQNTLKNITRDEDFSDTWFKDFVYDNKLPDFESLFDSMGLSYRLNQADSFSLKNFSISDSEDGLIVDGPVFKGSPFYNAGLGKGDIIKSVNGVIIKDKNDWSLALQQLQMNQNYSISYIQNGLRESGFFVLKPSKELKIVLNDNADIESISRRQLWLE